MSDDTMGNDDLEREIAEALGEDSVLEIAKRELFSPSSDAARAKAAGAGEVQRGFREGTVAGVTKDDVFVEFGPRDQGVVPFEQFAEEPEVGSTVRVFVEQFDRKEGIWSCSLRRGVQSAEWDALEPGAVIMGTVRAANTGGLELQCGVLTAFLPASHVSLERIEDLSTQVGERFEVEVIECDPEKKRLVVSRRGILGRQRDAARAEAVDSLQPGSKVKGAVTKIEPFGAFVDLGGVDGLVHVSEMSHVRVQDPNDHVKIGDVVEVMVQDVTEGGRRISLSMKALQEDPWLTWTGHNPVNSQVEGTVTRLASYGAFVKVAEGVEGLAHVSQLAPGGAGSPREVVHVGQTMQWRIAEIDAGRRRIGLSLLSTRGDRLTDDVASDAEIHAAMQRASDDGGEPTLGDLLKRAMEDKNKN